MASLFFDLIKAFSGSHGASEIAEAAARALLQSPECCNASYRLADLLLHCIIAEDQEERLAKLRNAGLLEQLIVWARTKALNFGLASSDLTIEQVHQDKEFYGAFKYVRLNLVNIDKYLELSACREVQLNG